METINSVHAPKSSQAGAQTSEVLGLLNCLEDQAAMLAASIANLEDRLQAVLEPIDQTAPSQGPVFERFDSRTPIGSMLQARLENLRDLRARVDSMLFRLGV